MPSTRLSFNDAFFIRRNGDGVKVHLAHSFLQRLGLSYSLDLTNGQEFNWRGYLANHCDGWLEELLEDHPEEVQRKLTICKFEARYFPVGDGQGEAGRFEFVAYRSDGKKFRIRPGKNGATENMPFPWAGHDTLCCIPTGNLPSRNCSTSTQKNRPEYHTDATGHEFLKNRERLWRRAQAVYFTEDLTSGTEFRWKDFFNRHIDSQGLVQRGIVECWLVWVGWSWQCSGFYLRFKNNTKTVYTRMPTGRWITKDCMVDDIYWAA